MIAARRLARALVRQKTSPSSREMIGGLPSSFPATAAQMEGLPDEAFNTLIRRPANGSTPAVSPPRAGTQRGVDDDSGPPAHGLAGPTCQTLCTNPDCEWAWTRHGGECS